MIKINIDRTATGAKLGERISIPLNKPANSELVLFRVVFDKTESPNIHTTFLKEE